MIIIFFLIMALIQSSLQEVSIVLPPTGASVCLGGNITLQCEVIFSNVAVPGIWDKGGTVINNNNTLSDHLITPFNSTGRGLVGLIITNVDLIDNNTVYSCNFGGETPDSATLIVAGPPSPIGKITIVNEVCSVNFAISWDPVNSNEVCGSSLYDVMIMPPENNGLVIASARINDTSYNITGVAPNTRYTVTVSGRNDAGMGQSNMTIVTTRNMTNDPIGIPSPNGTITVVDRCSSDFTISWKPFSSNPVCGLVSYNVMISPDDGVMWMSINDTFYNITRVEPETSYLVTVTGINDAGERESVTEITTRSMNSALPGLSELSNTTTTHSIIVVEWNLTSIRDCGDVSLDATIRSIRGSVEIIVNNNNTATSSNLENGTTYTITVTATNRAGSVDKTITVKTLGERSSTGGDSDSSSTGAIVGGVVGGIVAVIVIIVIIVVVYIFVIRPKGEKDSDTTALKMSSPTGTSTGGRVAPSSNLQSGPTEVYADVQKPVPHKTAATGEEYAVSTKATKPGKGKSQGPTEEYAQIDKSKKSGQQGIQYADLADLPQSTSDPSAKGPTSMYAQVA